MLTLSREIAPLGLVLLAVLLLAGCGGKHTAQGKSATKRSSIVAGASHAINMFPAPLPPASDGHKVVIHVRSAAITDAAYAHLVSILTPKIASYEPKSRADCSNELVERELNLSKHDRSKLSRAQMKALCVRKLQNVVKQTALQQMISYQWVIDEAAELGVGVSETEVQKRLTEAETKQFKSRTEFVHYLSISGRTLADVRSEFRLQMTTQRLMALIERRAQKKLTDAAITQYYREHKGSFAIPETRDIRAIRTWTHRAIASAMAEVRSGRSIADVAKRVSIDRPYNERGGLMEGIAKGQEEEGLDQAIFTAKPHVLVGPLHLRKRYYAFVVLKITPRRVRSFNEVEGMVRRTLAERLRLQETAAFVRAWRKKWLTQTSCSPGYVTSRCREYPHPSVLLANDPYELK